MTGDAAAQIDRKSPVSSYTIVFVLFSSPHFLKL